MRITHQEFFDPITIDDDTPQTLVLENPVYFRRILYDLNMQLITGRGYFVLSDDKFKILPIDKDCMLITDIFNLELSTRAVKARLTNEILNVMIEHEMSEKLTAMINQFAVMAEASVPYPIKLNCDITLSEVIKLLDVSIDITELTQIEQIIQFMELGTQLLDIKLFITINIKDFFTEKEYKDFIEAIILKKIHLLMVERHTHPDMDDNKNMIIIDKDLCVI